MSLWYGIHLHQVCCTHAQNHESLPLHPIHGRHHPRERGSTQVFPALPLKGLIIVVSKSEATSTETLEASRRGVSVFREWQCLHTTPVFVWLFVRHSLRHKKGKEVDISLTEEEWEEIVQVFQNLRQSPNPSPNLAPTPVDTEQGEDNLWGKKYGYVTLCREPRRML